MSCVLVMGCYRSGTSAVSGVLQRLGVFMGEYFDMPDKHNPQGYWEDLEFKRLHRRMISGEDVLEEYDRLVKKRSAGHRIWGMKDPLLGKYGILEKIVPLLGSYQVIRMLRPTPDILTSIMKVLGNLSPEQISEVQEGIRKHEQDISSSIGRLAQNSWPPDPHYRFSMQIGFNRLMNQPEGTILNIVRFLSLHEDPTIYRNAIDYINRR